ncbi:hypothetical protein BJX99DRAFT_207199 [Aspergillus californicus]
MVPTMAASRLLLILPRAPTIMDSLLSKTAPVALLIQTGTTRILQATHTPPQIHSRRKKPRTSSYSTYHQRFNTNHMLCP